MLLRSEPPVRMSSTAIGAMSFTVLAPGLSATERSYSRASMLARRRRGTGEAMGRAQTGGEARMLYGKGYGLSEYAIYVIETGW